MIEHETNTVPNGPPHGAVPDGANLEVYGDWVTVDAGPPPAAQPAAAQPAAAAASLEVTYQEPDSRTAPELTAAEEALLDQLSESERAADAAAPAAVAAPNGAGSQATDAALAKLERQLSSLSAELKAVGQQLAELRGRTAGAAEGSPEPAAAPPAPDFAAEADGDAVDDQAPVITLEALEAEAGPPAAAPADWGGHAAPEAAVTVADAAPAAVAVPAPEAPQVTVEPLAAAESPAPAPAAPAEPPAGSPAAAPQEDAAADAGQGAIQLTLDAAGPPPAAPGAEISGQVRADVRAVLAYLDQLLDALPPDKVKEFAQSEHFATYKKLFQEFGLDD